MRAENSPHEFKSLGPKDFSKTGTAFDLILKQIDDVPESTEKQIMPLRIASSIMSRGFQGRFVILDQCDEGTRSLQAAEAPDASLLPIWFRRGTP